MFNMDMKPINKDGSYYICSCKQICFHYYVCEECGSKVCTECIRNLNSKPICCKNCYYKK